MDCMLLMSHCIKVTYLTPSYLLMIWFCFEGFVPKDCKQDYRFINYSYQNIKDLSEQGCFKSLFILR